MGAQGSVEREEARYPHDREVKLVVAGCSWTTMPDLIANRFLDCVCEPTPMGVSDVNRRTIMMIIDEKRVRLQIRDIPIHRDYRPPDSFYFMERHRQGRHVGFMLLYDVRDETSFEAAKAKAITLHFGKVQISNAVDTL